MDFKQLLDSLIPVLGQAGVDALSETFKDLAAEQDKEWAQAALALLGDAIGSYGMAGIEMARKAIDSLLTNEKPVIDWANPRTASDFVAKLQNAEAEDKNAACEFFTKVGDVLGEILAGIIKGLVASV